MSILSWNCLGLGTPWTLQFLKEIVLQKRPNYIFLCEIFCKNKTVEKVRNMLRFDGMVVVESQGHGGGVAMLWRNKNDVTLNSLNKNHIDVNVSTREGRNYRLTGVYGEPDRSKRQET